MMNGQCSRMNCHFAASTFEGKAYCTGCAGKLRFLILDPERGYWLKRGHGYTSLDKEAHVFDGTTAIRARAEAPQDLSEPGRGARKLQLVVYKGTYAVRCEFCPGHPPPESSAKWQIVRVGDAIASWACDDHLVKVLARLRETRPDLKSFTVTQRLF